MSESISIEIKKHKTTTIGQVDGHNSRLHETKSQLPKSAWITEKGNLIVVPFNHELIEKAKSLKTRHDAVIAVEVVYQVGNQTDWRDLPTPEHPCGKRKTGASAKLNAILAGVKESAYKEFGKDRIVSISLHTDESTPHVHVVFVPIVDGKLQAKKWTNGPKACAFLLKKVHAVMNKHIPCTYTPSAPGGLPHDPSKAAGKENGPKPAPKPKNLLDKAAEFLEKIEEIKTLKESIKSLKLQMQTMFSKLKTAEKKAAKAGEKQVEAEERAKAAALAQAKADRKIVVLEREIARIAPYAPVKPEYRPDEANTGLPPRVEPSKSTGKHQKPI